MGQSPASFPPSFLASRTIWEAKGSRKRRARRRKASRQGILPWLGEHAESSAGKVKDKFDGDRHQLVEVRRRGDAGFRQGFREKRRRPDLAFHSRCVGYVENKGAKGSGDQILGVCPSVLQLRSEHACVLSRCCMFPIWRSRLNCAVRFSSRLQESHVLSRRLNWNLTWDLLNTLEDRTILLLGKGAAGHDYSLTSDRICLPWQCISPRPDREPHQKPEKNTPAVKIISIPMRTCSPKAWNGSSRTKCSKKYIFRNCSSDRSDVVWSVWEWPRCSTYGCVCHCNWRARLEYAKTWMLKTLYALCL